MPKDKAVKRAKAAAKTTPKRRASAPKTRGDEEAEFSGVRVTHPDRVLFAAQGVTKRDLIEYYLAVAELLRPHVAHRPLSLVRCPAGSGGACFFQKHASAGFPDQFGHIRIKEKSASGEYLTIEDERGLVAAVQVGVLELHIWGSHTDTLEKPDRMVFDFDPDEGLDLPMCNAARHARVLKSLASVPRWRPAARHSRRAKPLAPNTVGTNTAISLRRWRHG